MPKTILMLGTLDTKGLEFQFIRDLIIEKGHKVILIDVGVGEHRSLKPDISHDEVAQAAGTTIDEIVKQGKEALANERMAKGAVSVVKKLYQSGNIDGIISLGGTMGTSLGTAVMRSLPIGIPKVMVSTMASSDTRVYLDNKDIVMIPSVADILGLNPLTKRVLTIAAGAITGMVEADPGPIRSEKPIIGATMQGDLMHCMQLCKQRIEEKGYELITFAAVGAGGKTLEEFIEKGMIHGVFDLVPHETIYEVFDGPLDAGPNRLEMAGKKGIPQVIVPGKLDVIAFSSVSGVSERFKGRQTWMHNPQLGVVRLNKEEMALVGERLVEKLNRSVGPTAVILPLRGLSVYGKGWEEFYDQEADFALFDILKKNLKPEIRVLEIDCHINDHLFAEKAADLLDELMHVSRFP
jgi:uncharacterized protein (UPF0261 family)